MEKSPKKFTFKTEKPTGRYRSFEHDHHRVKYNKCEVGSIEDESPHKIRLQVMKKDILEDKNPNCAWKWIRLKKESASLQEAKDFLNANVKLILKTFTLLQEKD